MISVLCAILFAVLSSAASALWVAWQYEKQIRKRTAERNGKLEACCARMQEECAERREALARAEGVGIGQDRGSLQQRIEESLKNGTPVSIRMGRRFQQDA